jgi:hypothetical protein
VGYLSGVRHLYGPPRAVSQLRYLGYPGYAFARGGWPVSRPGSIDVLHRAVSSCGHGVH